MAFQLDILTPERTVYTGVVDESGDVVVPGVYPGSELGGDFQLWVTGPTGFGDMTANEITSEVAVNILHRQPGFDLDTFDAVHELMVQRLAGDEAGAAERLSRLSGPVRAFVQAELADAP